MSIPTDPVILLSYLNTQLRDHYASLAELCTNLGLNEAEITEKMTGIDYHYDAEQNQFI